MATLSQNDFIDKARQWGFEDGTENIPSRAWEYFIFEGEAYNAYQDGHADGRAMRRRLAGGSEVKYQPFSDPSLNSVQPAEYRDDFVGM